MSGGGSASALAAKAVQQAGQGSARGICETCCKSQVKTIDDETNRIAAIADPIQRNAAITKAYTDLAASEPDNRWVKLASIVSAQGGCAMKDVGGYRSWLSWKQPLDDATGMSFTNNMYQALGEAEMKVIQPVYDKYSGTFAAMSAASAIQKPFTGKNLYDIPVSTTCGDPATVPFAGNIAKGADRVAYYEDLMSVLKRQQGW